MKNGIKYLVAGLVATGLAVSSSYAVITVSYTAAGSSYVTDSTGAANYLSGDLVEIGAFTGTPTVGSPSLANFTVFSSTITGSGPLAGSYAGGSTADAGAFSHAQIYLVVFNQATANVVPGTTQLAIADVAFASDPAWKFPANADIPNTTAFDLDELFNGGTVGTLGTGATVYWGSTGTDGGSYNLLQTVVVPVPEPSTYVLVGTGLLGLLGLRRRS